MQKITGIFNKGRKEIVKVTFEQGQTVECCKDHLWNVITREGVNKTITTGEMIKDFKSVKPTGYHSYRYFIPSTDIKFYEKKDTLPLDPYLVGLLIGDGSLSDTGAIELSLGIKKEHILSKISLPVGFSFKYTFVEKKNAFRVKIGTVSSSGENIRTILDKIGLRNSDSYTKHIPKSYLISSRETREALLQGLIDTDGHINTRGLFEFSTVSEQLCSDFKFLCHSLGINIYAKKHIKKEGDGSYSKRPIYRFHELKGYNNGVKIQDISPTGEFTEMQCIKVSNPDQLYITDDFIVTHNTTSTAIISEAIVRYTFAYCKKYPKISPQKIVRTIQKIFKEKIEPMVKSLAITDLTDELLLAVAKCSANGDQELAEAVAKCFELVGDDGNVTILEKTGHSGYLVEPLKGYPITGIGFEDCCRRFFSVFVNDKTNNRVYLEKPIFLLYYGQVNEIQTLLPVLSELGDEWNRDRGAPHNVVVVASGGFSESVLGQLAANWSAPDTMNVFPLLVPRTPVNNGDMHFLEDLQAITASPIYDPIRRPIEQAKPIELGPPLEYFEAHRYRSNIVGIADEGLQIARAEEIKAQMANPEGELESRILAERLGKLTGGIAKLTVVGETSGSIREKKDRADDAACAIRGARKHGCLPGAGWTLHQLTFHFPSFLLSDQELAIYDAILVPSFLAPIELLMTNAGLNTEEACERIDVYTSNALKGDRKVWDGTSDTFVEALEAGIVDSVPAVLEAIRNSISIATLLGTLGGVVVFKRDVELERQEAADTMDYLQQTENPTAGTGHGGHSAIDL